MKKIKDLIGSFNNSKVLSKFSGKSIITFCVIMLFAVYILGTILGCNINFSMSEEALMLFRNIFSAEEIDENMSFFAIFISYISSTMFYLIAALFLGLCSIGSVLIYIVPFASGVGYGLNQIQLLYKASQNNNYALFLIDGIFSILIAIIIIFCCKQSLKMSYGIWQKSFIQNNRNNPISISLNSYVIKYLIYLLIIFFLNFIRICLIKLFV